MLVAAILPFRLRSAADWRVARTVVPVPHRPLARRRLPLLPAWLQSVRRPNPLLELLLIQVGYGVYTCIRNTAPNRVGEAVGHGQDILRAERLFHVDVEHTLNKAVLTSDRLTDFLENYYKTLHFAVPLAILAWLYGAGHTSTGPRARCCSPPPGSRLSASGPTRWPRPGSPPGTGSATACALAAMSTRSAR